MPYIQLPDKSYYPVADGVSYADALASAKNKYPDAFGIKPDEGVVAQFKAGAQELGGGIKTLGRALTGDASQAAQQGLEESQARERKLKSTHIEDVINAYNAPEGGVLPALGQAGTFLKEQAARMAPSMAASWAGAQAGAAAAPLLGPFAPVAPLIGGLAPFVGQIAGEYLQQQQATTPGDVSVPAAVGAAIPSAAVGMAAHFFPLGKNIVGQIFGPEVKKLLAQGNQAAAEEAAKQSLTRAMATGVGKNALVQAPAMVAQDMLGRLQAGQPILSDDAIEGYGKAALSGAALSPIGAIGGVQDRSAARAKVEQFKQATAMEQRKQAALAAAEEQRKQSPEYLEQQRIAGLTPEEYAYGQPPESTEPPVRTAADLYGEQPPAEPTAPAPNAALDDYIKSVTTPEQFAAGVPPDPRDVAEALVQRPDLAKQVLDSDELFPGAANKMQSNMWKKALKKQLAAQPPEPEAQPDSTQAYQQIIADRQQMDQEALAADMAAGREKAAKQRQNDLLEMQAAQQREAIRVQEEGAAHRAATDAEAAVREKGLGVVDSRRTPESERVLESTVDHGVISPAVARALRLGDIPDTADPIDLTNAQNAHDALPHINNRIQELVEQQHATLGNDKVQLTTADGELTRNGMDMQRVEVQLSELRRLKTHAENALAQQTSEGFIEGTLQAAGPKRTPSVDVGLEKGLQPQQYGARAQTLSAAHDRLTSDLYENLDELARGTFFKAPESGQRPGFADKRQFMQLEQTLTRRAQEARQAIVQNVLQEAAARREATGAPGLTHTEAIRASLDIRSAIDALIDKSRRVDDSSQTWVHDPTKDKIVKDSYGHAWTVQGRKSVSAQQARAKNDPVYGQVRTQGTFTDAAKTANAIIAQARQALLAPPPRKPMQKGPFGLVAQTEARTQEMEQRAADRGRVKDMVARIEQTTTKGMTRALLEKARQFLLSGRSNKELLDDIDSTIERARKGMEADPNTARDIIDRINTIDRESRGQQDLATGAIQQDMFAEPTRLEANTPEQFQRMLASRQRTEGNARYQTWLTRLNDNIARAAEKVKGLTGGRRDRARITLLDLQEQGKILSAMAKPDLEGNKSSLVRQIRKVNEANVEMQRALAEAKTKTPMFEKPHEKELRLAQEKVNAKADADIKKLPEDHVRRALANATAELDRINEKIRKEGLLGREFEVHGGNVINTAYNQYLRGELNAARTKHAKELNDAGAYVQKLQKEAAQVADKRRAIEDKREAELAKLGPAKAPTEKPEAPPAAAAENVGVPTEQPHEAAPGQGVVRSHVETAPLEKMQETELQHYARVVREAEAEVGRKLDKSEKAALLHDVRNERPATRQTVERTVVPKDKTVERETLMERVRAANEERDRQKALQEELRAKGIGREQTPEERQDALREVVRNANRRKNKTAYREPTVKPTSELPANIQPAEVDRLEEVRQALVSETNPKKKAELAKEFRQLQGRKNAALTRIENTKKKSLNAPTGEATGIDETAPFHGMTFAEAAEWGMKNTRDEGEKGLLFTLQEALKDAQGVVHGSKEGGGSFYPDENRVLLHNDRNRIGILIHELTHAATYHALETNPEFRAKVEDLRQRVAEWAKSEEGQKYLGSSDAVYGLTDAHEFLAETQGSKSFQKLLSQIPSETTGKSLWDKFVDAIVKLLGIKGTKEQTALHEALKLAQQGMMKSEKQAATYERVLRSPAPKYADDYDPDLRAVAADLMKPPTTFRGKMNDFVNGFRFAVMDSKDSLEKLSRKIGDQAAAEQMMYWVRQYEKVNNYMRNTLINGAQYVKKTVLPTGNAIYEIDTKGGASAKQISETLGKAQGWGDNMAAIDEQFKAYLASKRAAGMQDGWSKLYGHDVTPDQIARSQKMITKGDADPVFQDARKLHKEYSDALIDLVVQADAMDKETAAKLKAGGDYVSFYRLKGDSVDLWVDDERIGTIGNLKSQPYLKELVGGDANITGYMEGLIRNTNLLTDMAMRNLATKSVANTLENSGLATIGNGDGPADAMNRVVIRFKQDGAKKFALLDSDAVSELGVNAERVVMGMQGMASQLPAALKVLGVPSKIFRHFILRNPAMAFKQLVRDSGQNSLIAGVDGVPILNPLNNVRRLINDPELLRSLEAKGLVGSQVLTGLSEDQKTILHEVGSGKMGWTSAMAKLDHLNMLADAASRLTAYETAIGQGANTLQATLFAQETMNFQRRGASPSMRVLNEVIPFFNAQLQGLDVLYRGLRGELPLNEKLELRNKLAVRGTMAIAAAMTYATLMKDDEDYKKATAYDRYNYIFTKVPGTDQTLKVPVPFEAGYLFKSLPEMLVNYMDGTIDGRQALDAIWGLITNATPNVMPQAVKPIIEGLLNRDFYTGNDIENSQMQKMRMGERFGPNTTETAKHIAGSVDVAGREVGMSPTMLEHMIRGYTGATGMAALGLADGLFTAATTQPTSPPWRNPLYGQLLVNKDLSAAVDRAYNYVETMTRAKGTMDNMVKQGREADAREFAAKYSAQIAQAGFASTVQKQLGTLTQLKKQIAMAPGDLLSADKKRQMIVDINKMQDQYARQANAAFSKMSETAP